jgi:hypothetical protein
MHGFLWGYAGTRLSRSEWVAAAEDWAGRIRSLYAPHESFEEYNSPTYYGVDLYGPALWRCYGATEKIRAWGAEPVRRYPSIVAGWILQLKFHTIGAHLTNRPDVSVHVIVALEYVTGTKVANRCRAVFVVFCCREPTCLATGSCRDS